MELDQILARVLSVTKVFFVIPNTAYDANAALSEIIFLSCLFCRFLFAMTCNKSQTNLHPSLSLSLKLQTLIKQAYAAYAVAFAASDSRIIQ